MSNRRSIPKRRSIISASTIGRASKKADKNGLTLVFEDESGFSFVPNRADTWATVGQTPILLEATGRHNHTGIGFITRTPHRHLLKFRFTIFEGAARFEDFVFYLTEHHHFYGYQVIVLWDYLPAHHVAATHFEDTYPDWFEFEYLPAYSPDLNPVESCWHRNPVVPKNSKSSAAQTDPKARLRWCAVSFI